MDIAPETTGPVPAQRSWKRILIISVGVVVLVLGLGYVLWTYTSLGNRLETVWSIVTMPSELKQAAFISDESGKTTVYRIKGLSYVAEQVTGASLISAEQEQKGVAEILNTGSEYVLMVNGSKVYATTSPLLGVSLSTDGTKALVATQNSKKETVPVPAYVSTPNTHPSLWTEVLLHLDKNGVPNSLGNGVHGIFVDDTHVVRVSSVGLVSVDTNTGLSTVLVAQPMTSTVPAMLVSPDHHTLVWFDSKTHSFTLYSVTATTAQKSGDIKDVAHKTSYALSNSGLYILQSGGSLTKIKKAETTGSVTDVAMIPGALRITRVLIGSL